MLVLQLYHVNLHEKCHFTIHVEILHCLIYDCDSIFDKLQMKFSILTNGKVQNCYVVMKSVILHFVFVILGLSLQTATLQF